MKSIHVTQPDIQPAHEDLQSTYPDTMRQNITTFLSPYNPQDPPEILSEETAIIANVKYTNQQLLMNIINVVTQCGISQCNLKDLESKT
jgi:hypothetical protein